MRKNIKSIISLSLAGLVATVTIGVAVMGGNQKVVTADNMAAGELLTGEIEEAAGFTSVGEDKEETVYVISDATGNVKKTIVSDWLKNKNGDAVLADKSDLKNIENVKSDAGYTVDKDGNLLWDAKGEDIYYQGETDKKLPVDVRISYYVDGKEVKPEEMAGKSGKVTIRFDYTNNEKRDVMINGKKTTMYVPFTMISGMILSADKFSNVEVNSGKVISDGNKYVVLGAAFPGMEDNLNLGELLKDTGKEIEFPEYFEVTADVKDFALDMTVTIGSADLLAEVNLGEGDSFEEIQGVLSQLVDATNQLKDGTSQMNSGLLEFKNKFNEYSNGVTDLTNGVNQINQGVSQLNDKTGEFSDGLNSLLQGVDAISGKLDGEGGAVNGAAQLADGAAKVDEGVGTLKDKTQTLSDSVGQLAAGSKKVNDSMTAIREGFEDSEGKTGLKTGASAVANGSSAVAQGVTELNTQLVGMVATIQNSIETNNAQMSQIQAVLASGKNPATGNALSEQEIEGYIASLNQLGGANAALNTVLQGMNPEEMSGKLGALSAGANQVSAGAEAVSNGINQVNDGLVKLQNEGTSVVAGGMAQLNGAIPELTKGINDLKAGTSQVSGGAAALSSGISQLSDAISGTLRPGAAKLNDAGTLFKTSINQLYEGTGTASTGGTKLLSATSQITDGIGKLYDGSLTLDNGMGKYQKDAIGKITDFAEGTLKELEARLTNTVELAKDYDIYSAAAENKSTSVKFIYETEGVK